MLVWFSLRILIPWTLSRNFEEDCQDGLSNRSICCTRSLTTWASVSRPSCNGRREPTPRVALWPLHADCGIVTDTSDMSPTDMRQRRRKFGGEVSWIVLQTVNYLLAIFKSHFKQKKKKKSENKATTNIPLISGYWHSWEWTMVEEKF